MENIDATPEFGKRPFTKKNSRERFLSVNEVQHHHSTKSENLMYKEISPDLSNDTVSNSFKSRSSTKKKKSPKKEQPLFKEIEYNTSFQMNYSYNDSENPLIQLLAKKFLIRNDYDRKHCKQFLKEKKQIFEGFDIDYKSIQK